MNDYVIALIGLVVMLVVGFVVYGLIFKATLKETTPKLDAVRLILAAIGLYLVAWAFIWLYRNLDMGTTTNLFKGLYLGLLAGVGFTAIPAFLDSPYTGSKSSLTWAFIVNWVVSLALLGVVVGIFA